MFLTFFVNTIKAVYEYSDIMRASIARAETISAWVPTKLLPLSSPFSLVNTLQSIDDVKEE